MDTVVTNRMPLPYSSDRRGWWARVTGMARVTLAVVFTGLTAAACGSDSPTDVGVLSTITVTPPTSTLAISGTQQFTAAGTDSSGDAVSINPTWSIIAGGGTISPTGLFTAGTTTGTYNATVRATSGTISGTASIVVNAGALVSVAVTPRPVTMNAGITQQFTAMGVDAGGNSFAITPVWSVATGGGTINATGLFTAGATPGTYTNSVVATFGGMSGNATVIVSAPAVATITLTPTPVGVAANGTQQFTAVARDAGGNVVTFTPAWSVVAGGGTINAATGLFTAGATGGTFTNTVRATSEAITGHATVNVTTGPLATITLTPALDSTMVNGTQQFTAVGRDGAGNVFPITPVWSVTNGGGTIHPTTGLFTAGTTAGTFTASVRATSGAIFATATTVVTPLPQVLSTISVLPDLLSVAVGGTQQFTAVGRDQLGNVMPVTATWSLANGGGSIHPTTGLFTAGATAGTYTNTVTARSGTVSTVVTVTVTPTAPPAPLINLGTAQTSGVLAAQSITCVTGGLINADAGISPATTVTGFGGPCLITGTLHVANAASASGQVALASAQAQLAALTCPPANAILADLGGATRSPGVYCTAGAIGVTGTLTLNGGGDPDATFVFRSGTTLTGAGNIVLTNGAQARNVYWQVGTTAALAAASQWRGNIVAQGTISLADSAVLLGRALSRTGSVTLGTNNVIALP